TSLFNIKNKIDTLVISRIVDEELRERSVPADDHPIPFVFADIPYSPVAYQVGGSYEVKVAGVEETVEIRLNLNRGDESSEQMTVPGKRADLPRPAGQIARGVEDRVVHAPPPAPLN